MAGVSRPCVQPHIHDRPVSTRIARDVEQLVGVRSPSRVAPRRLLQEKAAKARRRRESARQVEGAGGRHARGESCGSMPATDRPLQGLDAHGQGDRASVPPGRRQVPRTTELEQKIEAELVKHLVRQARGGLTGFAIGTVTVAAVLVVLWNAAPRSLLLIWLISIGLLSLPAFVLVWRFTDAPDAAEDIASWRRALGVAYGLAGAGWGAAAILLYPRVAMPY